MVAEYDLPKRGFRPQKSGRGRPQVLMGWNETIHSYKPNPESQPPV